MKTTAFVAAFIAANALVYLYGAFIAGTFDAAQWDPTAKYFGAFLGISCGMVAGMYAAEQTP